MYIYYHIKVHMYIYIYIYIYMFKEKELEITVQCNSKTIINYLDIRVKYVQITHTENPTKKPAIFTSFQTSAINH